MLTPFPHFHSPSLDITCEPQRLFLPFVSCHLPRYVVGINHRIKRCLGCRSHGAVSYQVSDEYAETRTELGSGDLLWPKTSEAVADEYYLTAHELVIRTDHVRDALDKWLLGGAHNLRELRWQTLGG